MGWIQNMWRGYTDGDRASLEAKLAASADDPVGSIIEITRAEYLCWRASDYGRGDEIVQHVRSDMC